MIRFGPSGNSNSFYQAGLKHTTQTPGYLNDLGLNAFEYSFGRGVNMRMETAAEIGKHFSVYDIEVSGHAPYYINFASPLEENIQKSIDYVKNTSMRIKAMGGNRCIFHPGSYGKMNREEVLPYTIQNIAKLVEEMYSSGFGDIILCPETMGKLGQLGTPEEIFEICKLDKMLIPTFDFGHINSRGQGSLNSAEDYRRLIDAIFKNLGDYKAKNIHIHFSKIQYGKSGEIRHLTFEDREYGPEFAPLASIIKEYDMTPRIICESDGTQAEDAIEMKQIYESL